MEKPEEQVADVIKNDNDDHSDHHSPGTMVLTVVLLVSFIVYYFANWKALADVWEVR